MGADELAQKNALIRFYFKENPRKLSDEIWCKRAEEINFVLKFTGQGIEEKAFIAVCKNPKYQLEIGKEILSIDAKYFRPTEVDLLKGDPTKAKTKLGWKLEYDLPALVKDMMKSDLNLMTKDQYLKKGGYETLNYFE